MLQQDADNVSHLPHTPRHPIGKTQQAKDTYEQLILTAQTSSTEKMEQNPCVQSQALNISTTTFRSRVRRTLLYTSTYTLNCCRQARSSRKDVGEEYARLANSFFACTGLGSQGENRTKEGFRFRCPMTPSSPRRKHGQRPDRKSEDSDNADRHYRSPSPYPTALTRPALAPSASSCWKRMVPPWEPPVLEILSYVPEECHANLQTAAVACIN